MVDRAGVYDDTGAEYWRPWPRSIVDNRGWNRFDLVISDMGRNEDGGYVADAGIELARALHDRAPELPMLIYTGTQGGTLRDKAIEAGALEVTSSPTELLDLIRSSRVTR